MDAVIVGVSGFIGSALAAHLTRQGHHVLGLDVAHPRSPLPAEAEFQLTDIRSDDFRLNRTVDAVFYSAQSSDYRAGASKQLFEVNTHGGIRAFFAAKEVGASFFLYASSGNVYAPAFSPLTEIAAVRRDQPYALSKLAVEDWLAISNCQTKATSARLFGVFGPGQQAMLPAILRRKLDNSEPIQLERNPRNEHDLDGLRISFCFLDDAVRTLEMLANRTIAKQEVPQVINIGGAEPISIRTFADTMGAALGRSPRYELSANARPFDLVADVTRMKSLIDFPLTPFEEAIKRTVELSHE